jgi:hypothetical protein
MRIPPGVRSRVKIWTASLCAIAGLFIAWPQSLAPGNLVPIPESFFSAAAGPVAKIISSGSVYLLQTLGLFHSADGGLLQIHGIQVDLAAAGGGSRLLLVALALSVALALLSTKPVWERLYIAFSGLPIGLVCGVFRVTAGCVFLHTGIEWFARMVLFEFAGWATMVLAWSLLRTQRVLLSRLLIAPPARDVVPVLSGARMSDPTSTPVAGSATGSQHGRGVVSFGLDDLTTSRAAIAEESTAADVTGRCGEALVAAT